VGGATTSGRSTAFVAPPPTDVDVLLRDGSTARVRSIRADDAPLVVDFHRGLSAESVRLRFFTPHPYLSEAEIERLVHLCGPDRLALVAERAGRIIAVAEYDRDAGRDEAEVAFVVEDAYQGFGLATILFEHLASQARSHGIRRFVAYTLRENRAMLDVLRDAGFSPQVRYEEDEVRVVVDISPSREASAAADERDRVAVLRSMARLLRPKSVAVVGASRESGKIGHELCRNLVGGGFEGPVYPVNPRAGYIASVPCWPTVEAVPGAIDLALIAVPAAAVKEVVLACGRKGVGALVVVSAGFAELGRDGKTREREIVRLAHANGMRMVGPNCFGVVNTDPAVSMNATLTAQRPGRGKIGFASQSGALGLAILAEATSRSLGLSSFVSLGNKADVSGNDLLTWWEADEETNAILMYLESFGNPQKFKTIAQRVGRKKPIAAVKSGRSAAGSRAAASHTASTRGSDRAVEALFRQTGVVRVDTIEELFDVGEVLATKLLPKGRRIAIVSNAGGPAVLAADACAARHLEVPELSSELRRSLDTVVTPGKTVTNPVVLNPSSSPDTFRLCLELLLTSDEVDAVVVIITPSVGTNGTDLARAVVNAVESVDKCAKRIPVVVSFLGGKGKEEPLESAKCQIPCFTYPETAVKALAHAVDHGEWRSRELGSVRSFEDVDANKARRLCSTLSQGISAQGISDGPSRVVTGADALALLSTYGIPSTNGTDVTRSAGAGAGDKSTAEPGLETIVGLVRDDTFGALVLFGLAGRTERTESAVEEPGQKSVRLVPITDSDANEMVIEGFRSSSPNDPASSKQADVDALTDILLRMSCLAVDIPEVLEAELNPVVANSEGAWVIDAKLRLASRPLDRVDDVRHLR